MEWVDWFNHRRLNGYCDNMTHAEPEAHHYRDHQTRPTVTVSTM